MLMWLPLSEKKVSLVSGELERRKSGTNVPTRKNKRKIHQIKRIYKQTDSGHLRCVLAKLKGKLRIKATQERRLRVAQKRRKENQQFSTKGPRALVGNAVGDHQTPSKTQVKTFWKGILGVEGNHEPGHKSILDWKASVAHLDKTKWEEPPKEVLKMILKKMSAWKAPGPDQIKAFWWKAFHQAAEILWSYILKFIQIF